MRLPDDFPPPITIWSNTLMLLEYRTKLIRLITQALLVLRRPLIESLFLSDSYYFSTSIIIFPVKLANNNLTEKRNFV
ncbi:hypothetical protein CW304_12495 [Bacillus sp. UFRGS-B20]|nr:hypothetical protein CW304_12495 [Bacillus sp. UFRGS-B20]